MVAVGLPAHSPLSPPDSTTDSPPDSPPDSPTPSPLPITTTPLLESSFLKSLCHAAAQAYAGGGGPPGAVDLPMPFRLRLKCRPHPRQPKEHASFWGTAGRAPPRGTIHDDSQHLPRHFPGFGRTSDPPDCDSRIPDCRSSWGDSRSRWGAWAGSWKSTRPFLVGGASPCRPGPRCGG